MFYKSWLNVPNTMTRLLVFLVILFVNVVGSKHLPSYIKACKKSDPNLKECAKQYAIEALPHLLKGDRAYKIPNYNPFEVASVDSTGTSGLKLRLQNLRLYGLNKTVIQEVDFDLKNQHIHVRVFIPETITEAHYIADGKLFSLVIKDEGPATIKSDNVSVEYTIDYQLITKQGGKRFIDANNLKTNLKVNLGKSHYQFDNLFGGNKVLGDSFNMVLNENSKEVDDIAGDSNRSVINSIVITLINALFSAVPYDEMFID